MSRHRWTNSENTLWRVFPDGKEEECLYAGITHLTSAKGGGATTPCVYCEQEIPGSRATCPGCGGPRMKLVTVCNVQIQAFLPDGGNLMNLDEMSVLEVRRTGWNSWDVGPYFVDGGLSAKSIRTRYVFWPPRPNNYEPEPVCERPAHTKMPEGRVMGWYDGDTKVCEWDDTPTDSDGYVKHDCYVPSCMSQSYILMLRRGTSCPNTTFGCKYIAPELEPKKNTDDVIIRMSRFNLISTHIDSPVPLSPGHVSDLELTMLLECEAEFMFGKRKEDE